MGQVCNLPSRQAGYKPAPRPKPHAEREAAIRAGTASDFSSRPLAILCGIKQNRVRLRMAQLLCEAFPMKKLSALLVTLLALGCGEKEAVRDGKPVSSWREALQDRDRARGARRPTSWGTSARRPRAAFRS